MFSWLLISTAQSNFTPNWLSKIILDEESLLNFSLLCPEDMAFEICSTKCSHSNSNLYVTHCKGSLFDSAI